MSLLSKSMPALVILGLALIIFMMIDSRCNNSKVDALLQKQWETNNIVSQHRKEDSTQVTVANANYITKQDLKNSDNEMVKTIREDLVGPIRTLERTTRILSDRVEHLEIPVRDTFRIVNGVEQRGFSFDYSKPPFLQSMRGTMFDGNLTLDYKLKSEYFLEYHWKKPDRLFGPRQLELIITNPDPSVSIGQVQQFQKVVPVPFLKRPGIAFAGGAISTLGVSLLIESLQ